MYEMQSVLLLLQGVPDAELETNSQARLYDGSFPSAVRAGGNGRRTGHRTRPGQKAESPSSKRFCYICLEGDGDGKSSKLMRGCACRGDSAGFVHIECLTELSKSKEASGDFHSIFNGWIKCGNCKQNFQGALGLEMKRRFWRRYRSSQDGDLHYHSTRSLAVSLGGGHDEVDAANQLLDQASTRVGNHKELLLDLKLQRITMLIKLDRNLEALGHLQAMLPEAKVCTASSDLYDRVIHQMTIVLLDLGRYPEAYAAAAQAVACAKAKYGLEDPMTRNQVNKYAVACASASLGRVEEAKENFEYAVTTLSRVFGRDHPYTQHTLECMRLLGFSPEPPRGRRSSVTDGRTD